MESIVKQLRAACEESDDVSFRESYSGRAMYGRKCVGLTGSMASCMEVISQLVTTGTQDVFDSASLPNGYADSNCEATAAYDMCDNVIEMQRKLLDFSYDSMGMDMIIYWPAIEPEPEEMLTDEEIEEMSIGAVKQFIQSNAETYLTDEDDLSVAGIRATAKLVRDRMAEDHS